MLQLPPLSGASGGVGARLTLFLRRMVGEMWRAASRMTLGSDSNEAEGCGSSPSFYNVTLAILFLFFFFLVVAKGSAPDCGRTIA